MIVVMLNFLLGVSIHLIGLSRRNGHLNKQNNMLLFQSKIYLELVGKLNLLNVREQNCLPEIWFVFFSIVVVVM